MKEPARNIIIITAELKISSYDIKAAVALRLPKNAYLELALHPANRIP